MDLVEKQTTDIPSVFRAIKETDLAEVDKLAKAFDWVTGRTLEFEENEIELARALKDHETLAKVQMRYETMKSARGIFQDCFRFMFGRKPWEE